MYQMEIGLNTPVVEYQEVIGSILVLLHRRTVVVVILLVHRRTVVAVALSTCQRWLGSPRPSRSMVLPSVVVLKVLLVFEGKMLRQAYGIRR